MCYVTPNPTPKKKKIPEDRHAKALYFVIKPQMKRWVLCCALVLKNVRAAEPFGEHSSTRKDTSESILVRSPRFPILPLPFSPVRGADEVLTGPYSQDLFLRDQNDDIVCLPESE